MKNLLVLIALSLTTFFASAEESHQPKEFYCDQNSDLTISDLETLAGDQVFVGGLLDEDAVAADFSRYAGKWVVLDLSATWCWFCKTDMQMFESVVGPTGVEAVQIHIMYDNDRTDKYAQSREGTIRFLETRSRNQQIADLSFENIDFYHASGANFNTMQSAVSESGSLYFPGLTGTPYQLIFNPQGQLVFRGHFTNKLDSDGEDGWLAPFQRHYQFVKKLMVDGVCDPSLSGI